MLPLGKKMETSVDLGHALNVLSVIVIIGLVVVGLLHYRLEKSQREKH